MNEPARERTITHTHTYTHCIVVNALHSLHFDTTVMEIDCVAVAAKIDNVL